MINNLTTPDIIALAAIVFLLVCTAIVILWMKAQNAAAKAFKEQEDAKLRAHWEHLTRAQDSGATNAELMQIRAVFDPEQGLLEKRMHDAGAHFTKDELLPFGRILTTSNNYPPVPKTHILTVGTVIITYRVHISIAKGSDDAEPHVISGIESKLKELVNADPFVDLEKYQKPLGIVVLDKTPKAPIAKPIKGFSSFNG
jgi:hypothetical protein